VVQSRCLCSLELILLQTRQSSAWLFGISTPDPVQGPASTAAEDKLEALFLGCCFDYLTEGFAFRSPNPLIKPDLCFTLKP